MSEYVEKSLQESLFELKFMKEIGLFTDGELGKIFKKRREHEYKIRRRTKELKEYIEYIEYEKLVLDLIKKRRKEQNCYSERRKIEIPIYKRIRRQFQNACSRFPQCADLWVKQVQFCLEKNETQMIGVLFTNALRLHPHNESIWIMAAQHELQHNSSMPGARNFFHRALRQNPQSKKLYLEYFKMELLNAEKLRKEASKLKLEEEGEGKEEESEDLEEVMKGSVALAVFEAAVEEITDDCNFFISFANVCRHFPFADWIVDQIYNTLHKHEYWGSEEEAQCLVACRPLTQLLFALPRGGDGEEEDDDGATKQLIRLFASRLQQCRHSFQLLHQRFNSESMWQRHLQLLLRTSEQASDVIKQELLREAMLVCCEAFAADMMDEQMAEQWLDLLKQDALFGCHMAALLVHKWPSNQQMWLFLFQHLHATPPGQAEVLEVLDLLKHCSRVLNKEEVLVQVWRLTLHWLLSHKQSCVIKVFETGLRSASRGVKVLVKEMYLEWVVLEKSLADVRKLFERLFMNRPNSRALLDIYLKAENAQDSVSSSHVRKAYEMAVSELGDTCVDLWLEYMKFEMSPNGSPHMIAQIYYKAVKCLNSGLENDFIEKYSILKASNCGI